MVYNSFGDPAFELKRYIGSGDISRTFKIVWGGEVDIDSKKAAEKYATSIGIQIQRDSSLGTFVTATPVQMRVLMDQYEMNVQEIMG